MSDLVPQQVHIASTANPSGSLLMRARLAIQGNEKLEGIFLEGKVAGEIAPLLADNLALLFPMDISDVQEVAQYLADEYEQVGAKVLLVDRETGKPLGQLSPQDYYQPAPVPRDDGRMVERPIQVRPEVQAFFLHRRFSQEREAQILEKVALKLASSQTALLKEEGDPRLLFFSAAGRETLLERIRGSLPRLFDGGVLGLPIKIGADPKGDAVEVTAFGRVSTTLVDISARNPGHNIVGGVLIGIKTQWSQDIARTIAREAQPNGHVADTLWGPILGSPWDVDPTLSRGGPNQWIADPEMVWNMRQDQAFGAAFPLESSYLPVALWPEAGYIVIDPDSYICKAREIFDRWEVAASMKFQVFLNINKVKAYSFTGMPAPTTILV